MAAAAPVVGREDAKCGAALASICSTAGGRPCTQRRVAGGRRAWGADKRSVARQTGPRMYHEP
eukprot:364914-Chlamydomonas_euryale.AAC.5